MRFLVDANLSFRLADELTRAGHDAVHVNAVGMAAATDTGIVDAAAEGHRVVLSADTDFGTVLALTGRTSPSVVLLRLSSPRRFEQLAALLEANLPSVADALEAGAVVVIEDDRVRVRALPLR